ncbi:MULTISPECIES: winged helix-turn-helix domain-containing protein [unclassified Serratia (in: enterobacteria)]|uniref:winged helix-turn-helix domain-containing protein n=1 Tax=unclassified Serratia (in: enterobacteria) TaxID=2647522 RepID=UPI0030766127
MNKKFLINKTVFFYPDEHRLVPTGEKGSENALNLPVSRCLLLLLQKPNTVISQQEFFKHVWENQKQYVTTNAFYQNISLLRRGLKSAGLQGNIIQTVPKEGIKFSGSVTLIEEEEEEQQQQQQQEIDTGLASERPAPLPVKTDNHVEEKLEDTSPLADSDKPFRKRATALLSSKNISSSMIIHLIIVSASLLFFWFTCQQLYHNVTRTLNYFSAYHQIGEANQCLVFAKTTKIPNGDGEYLSFMKERKISCEPGQIAYITANDANTRMSVHICNKSPSGISSCLTHYFFEYAHEQKIS